MRLFLLVLLIAPAFLLSQNANASGSSQVDSLILVSRAYTNKLDFDPAMATGAAATKMARACCGSASEAYASACFNEGRIRYFQGDYDAALPWYLESKDIRLKILGPMHIDYGKSLNNLAVLYEEMGLYEKAEPVYLEALHLREKVAGKESIPYASVLQNMAGLYRELGDFEQSEDYSLQALDIIARIQGLHTTEYADGLMNLANLYYEMEIIEKAERFYLESKSINESIGETERTNYILLLDNLGALYQYNYAYDKAESFYNQAAVLGKNFFGDTHVNYLAILSHLAVLNKLRGRMEKSEGQFLELMQLSEEILGKEHVLYGRYLLDFTDVYLRTNQYQKALDLSLQSRQILEKAVSKEHPQYMYNQVILMEAYWGAGDFARAKACWQEFSEVSRNAMTKNSRFLSARELSSFSESFHVNQMFGLSFTNVQPELAGVAYDNLLFYKGYLLNAVQQMRRLSQSNPEYTEKYQQLQGLQRRLSAQYALELDMQEDLAPLEDQANVLEKELAKEVNGLGIAMQQVSWKDVQARLQPGEAAIEFTWYQQYLPYKTDNVMYAALVLLPSTNRPVFIPLFEQKQLALLFQNKGKNQDDFLNELYASGQKGDQLYRLLWRPLENALQGVHKVYYSPSGLLHRLNIGAIPSVDGKVIGDKFQLANLGSTRQLIQTGGPLDYTKSNAALLFGGIRYELDTTNIAAFQSKDQMLTRNRGLDMEESDSTLRGNGWGYLKWTDVEVSTIEDILKEAGFSASVQKGADATEELFKQSAADQAGNTISPRVLHLATHGFFFPDKIAATSGREGMAFKTSSQPMIRSGLVLAGGNHAWQTGKPIRPFMEDGILTAYEVSRMNLSNTELVVLSACETGLGDIRRNEGVFGLQRAFKIAGTHYLIMTLWQVPDFQAQAFMTAFYSHWLDDKQPIPDAFRSAQLDMRTQYNDPFKWAGFILVE